MLYKPWWKSLSLSELGLLVFLGIQLLKSLLHAFNKVSEIEYNCYRNEDWKNVNYSFSSDVFAAATVLSSKGKKSKQGFQVTPGNQTWNVPQRGPCTTLAPQGAIISFNANALKTYVNLQTQVLCCYQDQWKDVIEMIASTVYYRMG